MICFCKPFVVLGLLISFVAYLYVVTGGFVAYLYVVTGGFVAYLYVVTGSKPLRVRCILAVYMLVDLKGLV